MTDINFDEINRELQESEQPKTNGNTINLTLEQIRELLNPNKQQTVQSKPVETEQPEVKPKKEKKPMSEKKRLAVEKMKEGRRRQIEYQKQMKQQTQQASNYQQPTFQQSFQQPTEVDVSNPPYVPQSNNPQMNYLPPEQIYQQYQQQQPRGQVYDYSVPPPQPTPQPVYQNPQQDMYQQRHPQVSKFASKPKTQNVFDTLGFQYFDSKSSKPPSTSKPQSKAKAKGGGPINPFEFFR